MKSCRALALVIPFTVLSSAAWADCTPISSLPYTISVSGEYCLTSDLSAPTDGAISIDASRVTLDLNGHALAGNGAGWGITNAWPPLGDGSDSLVIRNGVVRGFGIGVSLSTSRSVVENVRFERNTSTGLWLLGTDNLIRRNRFVATGGTEAIYAGGQRLRVLDNDIVGFASVGPAQSATGIFAYAEDCLVERNRVVGATTGIRAMNKEKMISANRIQGGSLGIEYSATPGHQGTGKYRDNLTTGVTTPYLGGTDVGGNN
jgi:hypothetical protein